MERLNKLDYSKHPIDIPDTDDGNLRLYYELELLRSNYESERLNKQLARYIQIIDVLGDRGLMVDFSTDLEIDKSTRSSDWYGVILKPIPSPRKNEERGKFISRCISSVAHADPERKHVQVIAMCHEAWRRRKKSDSEPEVEEIITPAPPIHIHLGEESMETLNQHDEFELKKAYMEEKLQLIKWIRERLRGVTE